MYQINESTQYINLKINQQLTIGKVFLAFSEFKYRRQYKTQTYQLLAKTSILSNYSIQRFCTLIAYIFLCVQQVNASLIQYSISKCFIGLNILSSVIV